MNAKQAKQNKYAKCKRTGRIWEYEYFGFDHPQRYCYITIFRNGAYHRDFAKGYDVSNEAEFLKQSSSI